MKITIYNHVNSLINNINMEILLLGHSIVDHSWDVNVQDAPFNRLYFVIGGEATVENQPGTIKLEKGFIYLLPAHSNFICKCSRFMEKYYIHFKTELFPGHDLFTSEDITVLNSDINKMKNTFCHMKDKRIRNALQCKGFIYETLSNFINGSVEQRIYEQTKLKDKYRQVFEYLDRNCFGDITIKSVAANLNTSSYILSRSFKKDTGYNLKSFIDNRVTQKAKELLLYTNGSVKSIAYELRFNDEFYFSNFFKRHAGVSPTEYRKQNSLFP